jgi:hypothetical protein
MNKYLLNLILGIVCITIFYYLITIPNGFNFIHYQIHETFFREIIDELLFIGFFNFIFSILLFFALKYICNLFFILINRNS